MGFVSFISEFHPDVDLGAFGVFQGSLSTHITSLLF